MQVYVPTFGGRRVLVPVPWRSNWGPAGEIAVHSCSDAAGTMRVYASGTAVVEMRAMPIVVRLRCRPIHGVIRLVWPTRTREDDVMALRKMAGESFPRVAGSATLGDTSTWPCLIEYLTATSYPDGVARQVSSLIIVADTSGWRGCVSDKDNERTMWRSAATLEALLLELEQALAVDDPASWRAAGGGFRGRKKRS